MVALALHASRGELRLRESGRGGAGRREWAQQVRRGRLALRRPRRLRSVARSPSGASPTIPNRYSTGSPQQRSVRPRREKKNHGDSNFSEHGRICEPRAWHTASGRRGPGGWCAFDDVRRTLTSPILRRSRGAPFGAMFQCASVRKPQGLTRGSSGPRLRCDAPAHPFACAAPMHVPRAGVERHGIGLLPKAPLKCQLSKKSAMYVTRGTELK